MKKPKLTDYVDDSMADAHLFREAEGEESHPKSETEEESFHTKLQKAKNSSSYQLDPSFLIALRRRPSRRK